MHSPLNRFVLTGVLALGTLSGFIERGTFAYFTDSATSTSNAFTTGTIELLRDGNGGTQSALPSFTLSNMIPGETRTSSQLALRNSGNLELCYTLTITVTDGGTPLASNLTFAVVEAVDGVIHAASSLASGTVSLSTTAPTGCSVGSRRVTGGGADNLSFQFTLASGAGTGAQTGSAAVSLQFDAVQTS